MRQSAGIAADIGKLKGRGPDLVLWCKLDQNVFGFESLLGAVHIPPDNSEYFCGDENEIR